MFRRLIFALIATLGFAGTNMSFAATHRDKAKSAHVKKKKKHNKKKHSARSKAPAHVQTNEKAAL